MNNDGSKLREAMGRHLDGLQPGTPIEHIRRRAHRGRLFMATSLVALVALVGASGTFMLDRLADDEVDRVVGPAPSSDDELITFVTQGRKDPAPWIAVVPADGGEVTRLHEGNYPTWSPDGTRIAFGCGRGICTMNADGSDVRQLTDPREPAFDESPDWGPNGWIAFTRNYMDNPRLATARPRDIVLVAPDGGQQVTITNHDSDDSEPTWSPDGRSIAYIRAEGGPSEAPPGGWQLWTMDADGGNAEMLTDIDGPGRPEWSPDGQTILFDRASALWTIPPGGGEPRKLPVVSGQAFDVGSFAAWAPDSRRIAFMCSSTGTDNNDICLSDVDSEEWTALVATDENEASPAWQPITRVEGPTPSPTTAKPPDQKTADDFSSDLPPCEDDQRTHGYGKTPPGEWLEALLLELGAPGGHSLTGNDVRDTGTALWIDIPEYDNDPTIYATILTPGIDPNVTESQTKKEIGRVDSYTIYFDDGNPWQSYSASNGTWQLSLIAYPGAGSNEISWPEGTVDWLKEAAAKAEQSPPQCEGPIT